MSVSADLKQRVLAALAEVPSPTRAEVLRWRASLCGCGIAGAVAIFLLAGGIRATSRPLSLVALTSAGTAIIVGLGMRILFTRGGSVLGRPVSRLVGAAVASSVLFVAWRYGVGVAFGQVEMWPARPGFRCLSLGVVTGALPLLSALFAWGRTVPVSPAATGAAFGAGAGLGSAFLVDLWCPVSYLPHLLLGHLLPVGILALLGGALGARVLRIGWR